MARTPEGRVKAKAIAYLKEAGAYYFYPVTGGFGSSGVPDIVACHEGRFFGIECKAGRNKPTTLQLMNLKRIRETGGVALIVDETNVDALPNMLRLGASNVE